MDWALKGITIFRYLPETLIFRYCSIREIIVSLQPKKEKCN